jgi:tRNA (guanine-N7-)-methyltransferase
MSTRQAQLIERVLPTVALSLALPAPPRLAELFPAPTREVWLEVGFGAGEHLLWQAKHHHQVGFIGCEPFQDGVIKVLSALADAGLRNIRLYPDDARTLLPWLPEGSLGRIFILFPDPWPKTRHHKRRLISPATLAELARVLRPGGELRLATDVDAYAEAIAASVGEEGSFRPAGGAPAHGPARPADWPATRYEQKALRAGRSYHYFCLRCC